MKESYSSEERRQIYEQLSAQALVGRLTEKELADAMLAFDERRWYPSVGTKWIEENPELFGQCIKDAERFLRVCSQLYNCICRLLLVSEILQLIPGNKLEAFVYDAYVRCGAHDASWVKVALEVGVSRETIARAIIKRLENADHGVIADFLVRGSDFGGLAGCAEAARLIMLKQPPQPERFVKDGRPYRRIVRDDGRVLDEWWLPLDRPWGVLTAEELEKAFRLCAKKEPVKVLSVRSEIGMALRDDIAAEICEFAVSQVNDLREMSGKFCLLNDIKLATRLELAKRLKPFDPNDCDTETQTNTVGFILGLVFSLDQEKGRKFFSSVERLLISIPLRVLARAVAWNIFLKLNGNSRAPVTPPPPNYQWFWIWHFVERQLQAGECIMGKVQLGTFKSRGSTYAEKQYEISYGGDLYVVDRYQHRYMPLVGDVVIIHPLSAKFLTRRGSKSVWYVNFVPLDKRRD